MTPTTPAVYAEATRVRLPDDVRKEPLDVVSDRVTTEYVTLAGPGGAEYRLDFTSEKAGAVALRYHNQRAGRWDVNDWVDPDAIEVIDGNGDSHGLAESALADKTGGDRTIEDLPGDWTPVTPGEADPAGLDQLFGEDNGPAEYAAQLSAMGLVQLLRGEPVTIAWGEADDELTLYPPMADGSGGDV